MFACSGGWMRLAATSLRKISRRCSVRSSPLAKLDNRRSTGPSRIFTHSSGTPSTRRCQMATIGRPSQRRNKSVPRRHFAVGRILLRGRCCWWLLWAFDSGRVRRRRSRRESSRLRRSQRALQLLSLATDGHRDCRNDSRQFRRDKCDVRAECRTAAGDNLHRASEYRHYRLGRAEPHFVLVDLYNELKVRPLSVKAYK